jgi:sec-independent protein translocase protein TatA
MFGLGMGELVVIFFIILLLFGAKNLPEMAKSLGKSVRDFRKAANDVKEGLEADIKADIAETTEKKAAEKALLEPSSKTA